MSSLIAAYTFNEMAAHDFSGNKYHLSGTRVSYATTTSANGGFGYDAIFSGDEPQLYCTSFASFASLTGFTCFFNFQPTIHDTSVCYVSGAFHIYVTGSNQIQFQLTDSTAATHTLTSTGTITLSTWNTVGCVWDGSYMYIYINGVLDSTLSVSFSAIGAGTGGLTIGGGTFAGYLNMFELRNAAMNAAQITSLNASPGGCQYTVDVHNFLVGDLIADPDVVAQGVVTWVIDQSNFYYYPLTSNDINPIAKYGNVYNTARQNIMEILNDFDGNGSSQIRIKYPIASFADYASPLSTITLDHNGLSGSASNIANMMAITSLRI